MGLPVTFIGVDVHRETITAAVAGSGERGEAREYGRIANTPEALTRLVAKLERARSELRCATKLVHAATGFSAS